MICFVDEKELIVITVLIITVNDLSSISFLLSDDPGTRWRLHLIITLKDGLMILPKTSMNFDNSYVFLLYQLRFLYAMFV